MSSSGLDFTTLLSELTLEEKVKLLSGNDFSSSGGVERLGLPPIQVADSVSGIRDHDIDSDGTTVNFPNTACYGATWDANLLTRLGHELARQALAKKTQLVLGPTINIHRDPRGGRNFECFSEDPLLSGQLAGAIVNGLRAEGCGVCPKHFVLNDSETLRHYYNVEESLDSRTAREIYMAAWQHLLRVSGPDGVMMAYNQVDGTFCSEHGPLIKRVLRGDWGFKGITMSDWFGVHTTVESVKAGLDLEMPFPVFRAAKLVEAVKSGAVAEDELNALVLRMLALRNKLSSRFEPTARQTTDAGEASELAWELAVGGLVLLKNDNQALPVEVGAPSTPKIAIIGEYAKDPVTMGGGSASCTPQYKVAAVDLWRERVDKGDDSVRYAAGVRTRRIIPVASEAKLVSKDGRPGVDVAFFQDGSLPPIIEEHSEKSAVWMLGKFKPGVEVPGSRVQITTKLVPETSGEHTLATRCTGDYDLFINDECVKSGVERNITVEQFIFNHILLEDRVQVRMEAGVPYSIRLEMRGPKKLVVGEPTPYAAAICFEEAYDEEAGIAEAVAVARESDISIIYAGRNDQYESEGYDLDDIRMPANQTALIKAVAAASRKSVLVMHAGNPIDVSAFVDDVDAILLAHFPGQEGTRAIIDVLTGKVSPSGRLATTWFKTLQDFPSFGNFPAERKEDGSIALKYAEGMHIGYRCPEREGGIRWPFGFGLSYAQFAYNGLTVTVDEKQEVPKLKCQVTVTNVGDVAGMEVIQVYVTPNIDAAVWRPAQELKAFKKLQLQSGEGRTVVFELDVDIACSYWDEKEAAWRQESGTYGVMVGTEVASFSITKGALWNHR